MSIAWSLIPHIGSNLGLIFPPRAEAESEPQTSQTFVKVSEVENLTGMPCWTIFGTKL